MHAVHVTRSQKWHKGNATGVQAIFLRHREFVLSPPTQPNICVYYNVWKFLHSHPVCHLWRGAEKRLKNCSADMFSADGRSGERCVNRIETAAHDATTTHPIVG